MAPRLRDVSGVAATVLTVLVALMGVAALALAVSALARQRANSARLAAVIAANPLAPSRVPMPGDEPSDEATVPTPSPTDP